MASDQRLHPASILFAMGRSLKAFALPGLLLMVTAGRSSGGPGGTFGRAPANWELWMMLLIIPSAVAALVRYLTFRIRYEGTELVIRSGLIFRNERHIPYARIQNLDGVQNVVHRALGVVEVRVETGAGSEPEARISVLPEAAYADMRRRVLEGRPEAGRAVDEGAADTPAAAITPLLQLSVRELLLYGLLDSRGLVVIGAAYGVLWELGLLERVWQQVFEGGGFGKGFWRSLVQSLFAGGAVPWRQLALAAGGIVVLLVLARLASMAWSAVRMYGFRLQREADDLRVEFGLFTRVTSTIPIRRIQTITVHESPLQRWVGRTSIRVETAGGESGAGAGSRERQWLAPIIPAADCRELVRSILPELDLAALDWQPVHPRAFRRAVKPVLFLLLAVVLPLVWPVLRWRGLWILVPLTVWAVVSTRRQVAHLRWAETGEIVAFGSGWLWRRTTAARMSKVQAVTRTESPFDRRAAMAGVQVDTAGAGDSSHRVAVPYLARDVAEALHRRLADRAASTPFRW